MISQPYTPEFKKKVVRLQEEEGRTIERIMSEYGIAKSTISRLCKELREECQKQAQDHPELTTEFDMMKENLRLRKELEELRKENLFLKKAAAFFAKEIDERLIDLSTSTKQNSASVGCCIDSIFTQMLIIIIENSEKQNILHKKKE